MQSTIPSVRNLTFGFGESALPDHPDEHDVPDDAIAPHHRALVIQLWAAILLCTYAFEWAGRREAAVRPAAVWVYVVLAFAWPLTPLMFLLVARTMSARFSVDATRWRPFLAAHAIATGCLVAFDFGSQYLLLALSPVPIPPVRVMHGIALDVLSYVVMVAMFELGRRTMQYRRLELARAGLGVQVAEARRRRTEAELRALKAELNPHFLGNALASVTALLRTDADAADRTLAQIGELVGRLGRRGTHEVTIDEELEGLAPVLEYERLRLSGCLTVSIALSTGAGNALVPDMILHPLVENAVKYGLAPHGGGTLLISAERVGPEGRVLALSVRDAVDDRAERDVGATVKHGSGLGLSNVRSRLAELYGDSARLVLDADGPHATVARVTMPWRDEDSAPFVATAPAELKHADDARAAADGAAPFRSARLRAIGGSVARVAAAVGGWAVLTKCFYTLVLQVPAPPRVRPDDLALLIDAMCSAALRVGLIGVAIALASRYARQLSASSALRTHFLVAFAFGVIGTLEKVTIITLRDPARWTWMPASHLARNVTFAILAEMVWYLAAAAAATAAIALWRTRWSRTSQLRLHQQLEDERHRRATAELRALESELNPHFVGNALGVVSSLVHTDRAAATLLLEELGVLLRAALSRTTTHEVTLRDELTTLRSFLEVEHARLGRRVDVRWLVEEGALDGWVPHMILQPLVENAVKHGLAPRREAGRIDIEARRGDRELELVVRDDGVGVTTGTTAYSSTGGRGVGLANTRARLCELYGPMGRLDLSCGEGGGTVARVRIPWHLDSIHELDLVAGGGVTAAMPQPRAIPAA